VGEGLDVKWPGQDAEPSGRKPEEPGTGRFRAEDDAVSADEHAAAGTPLGASEGGSRQHEGKAARRRRSRALHRVEERDALQRLGGCWFFGLPDPDHRFPPDIGPGASRVRRASSHLGTIVPSDRQASVSAG